MPSRAMDTPVGRSAMLADPQGAAFTVSLPATELTET